MAARADPEMAVALARFSKRVQNGRMSAIYRVAFWLYGVVALWIVAVLANNGF